MRYSILITIIIIAVHLKLNVNAQHYDHDEELQRLQPQQPPLNMFSKNQKQEMKSTFRSIDKNVRPLEQKFTAIKQPTYGEHLSEAASNYNFGIRPLASNNLNGDDEDIITYSHDTPPFPYNLRRPQLELLSSGGAGYSLLSADVLVPPFRDDDMPQRISNERRPFPQLASSFGVNNIRPSTQHVANEEESSNYLANNELPEPPPAGTIEYASGYLPFNQLSANRPIIQYGSPYADFRRPNVYAQSNQLAYAPIRAESGVEASKLRVPYPPSFISITTARPLTEFIENGVPHAVRPLGRALAYEKPFRPSAVDPVPDFFATRQSKSLLDSYIPSWVIARMLEQQRNNGYANMQHNRQYKRSDMRSETTEDVFNAESQSTNSKIIKKSLDDQMGIGRQGKLMRH